jgi:ComF family protein
MSDRFNDIIQKNLIQEEHAKEVSDASAGSCREPYAYAAALFTYHAEASYRHIPYSIKYKGNVRAGEYFGRMLGSRLIKEELWADAETVIPVPLHWTRKFRRGYNQAEAIASGLASAMGIKVRNDILIRIRQTRTQTKLDIEGKTRNVAGAFKAGNCSPEEYRHIIIVDDVFTTGSTLFACFTALRTVFPPGVRISVATLGFVGGV